jgi:hypothetical protein
MANERTVTMAIVAQRDWRFCAKCFGLFFNGRKTKGVCPAGGEHSKTGSGDYALIGDPDQNIVMGGANLLDSVIRAWL